MSHVAAVSVPAAGQVVETADLGGDQIERALRLGASIVGCPLVFTEAGTLMDAAGGRFPALPGRAFEETQPVLGQGGEALGTLRASAFAGRLEFGWEARRALADVAALIAGDLTTRARIGQTDHVTGLPNRRRFEADFPRAARAAGPEDRLILVTLADARHYNEILRALGHACAETFVRRGVEMIRAAIGRGRDLHHVSVLSFAFVARGDCAEAQAAEIVKAFARPVPCDGLPITTRIGVGLTRINSAVPRPAETLRAALAAAQDSRRVARGFSHYDRRSDEAHLRAFCLLTDLEAALRREGELSLVFQPRIDLATGAIAAAEVLIRWTHPTLGPVSPSEFIPLAETTALMGDLTRFVLERACRQSAAWRSDGVATKLSINVSPSNLLDPEFLDHVTGVLGQTSVEAADIEFEFTEGTLTSTEAGVRATIDAIRATGATVAIDDFGTGYSNLDYLTRLPADVLKLDRSFILPLDADPRRQKLVRSMIDLSHELGFRIVGEGVETASVYDMLAGWGCDEGQGFFMSRPLTATAFAAFAASR